MIRRRGRAKSRRPRVFSRLPTYQPSPVPTTRYDGAGRWVKQAEAEMALHHLTAMVLGGRVGCEVFGLRGSAEYGRKAGDEVSRSTL